MNGLTAAKGLRRSVEQAGGTMRISLTALGDAFGRGKLTVRARKGIQQVLEKAGLDVTPDLWTAEPGDWVTLSVAQPRPAGAPVRDLMPPRQVPPALAAAVAFILPVLLASVFVIPSIGAERAAQVTTKPSSTPAEQAQVAVRAGEFRTAVRLVRSADPEQVPRVRSQIAQALVRQARAAQRERAYVRAIKLARRAARYGPAPQAGQIVTQARAGLDLRREALRREARAGRPSPR